MNKFRIGLIGQEDRMYSRKLVALTKWRVCDLRTEKVG